MSLIYCRLSFECVSAGDLASFFCTWMPTSHGTIRSEHHTSQPCLAPFQKSSINMTAYVYAADFISLINTSILHHSAQKFAINFRIWKNKISWKCVGYSSSIAFLWSSDHCGNPSEGNLNSDKDYTAHFRDWCQLHSIEPRAHDMLSTSYHLVQHLVRDFCL